MPDTNTTLLYRIALTLVPQIGPVQARLLLQHFSADEIFRTPQRILEKIEGIGQIRARNIARFSGFDTAAAEIAFIEKNNIRPLFITDAAYPRRLLHCYDAPLMLYYRGAADLNAERVIAVIGTRNPTEYGKLQTEKLVEEMPAEGLLVISGLAYGIDAAAHRACVKNQIPTVGILAHGLDQVYPPQHTSLAREMTGLGGLLTEFRSCTAPDRHNFPIRNRIVAGMADAVIVMETGLKGGSIITAELANSYNKDVFALPGKITDTKSAGCNLLIRNNKAALYTDAASFTEAMNWCVKRKKVYQKQLFTELNDNEKTILSLLESTTPVHIDELNNRSGLSSSHVAGAILSLELQGLVTSLPGKMYTVC